MANQYNISVTNLKVLVETIDDAADVTTIPFSRDKNKATYTVDSINIVSVKDAEENDTIAFEDITEVVSITDYRSGSPVSITVPANLSLLYDIIEDVNDPFFFESPQIDANGSVGVDVTTEAMLDDLEKTAINTKLLNSVLIEQMITNKILMEVFDIIITDKDLK